MKIIKKLVLTAAVLAASAAAGAPFDFSFAVTNSQGTARRVRMFGDEFQVAYEAEDGRTLLREGGRYFYAKQGESNSLESTGIELGQEGSAEFIRTLPPRLRDRSRRHLNKVRERIDRFENVTGFRRRWKSIKASRSLRGAGMFSSPPSVPTVGCYTGLTILVDFPIDGSTQTLWQTSHPDFTTAVCDNFLNGDNFTMPPNQSSVRKFYKNISNNALDYRNVIIGPVLMNYPREHYDDPSADNGDCAKMFINELFDKIFGRDGGSGYAQLLPTLRALSRMAGYPNYVAAVNILYAGNHPTTWSKGLWPHSWSIFWRIYDYPISDEASADRVRLYNYQMTSIKSTRGEIYIGTFCHENGHMLCNFPDLYEYISEGSVGVYSLMGSGNYLYPPAPVDPYLAEFAGWITPIVLQNESDEITLTLPHDIRTVYKFICPTNPNRYFLIENRQKSGLDAGMIGSGVLIWRCDTDGDNRYPESMPIGPNAGNQYAKSYELALVQADGLYSLEQGQNRGDVGDYWYNRASSGYYQNRFDDGTVPTAKWIDGTDSLLHLHSFSENGETMTCKFWAGLSQPEFAYTGSAVTPAVVAQWKGTTLVQGTDYALVYSNNVNVGTAYVYVKGVNNFTGQVVKKFKIVNTPSSSPRALMAVFGEEKNK